MGGVAWRFVGSASRKLSSTSRGWGLGSGRGVRGEAFKTVPGTDRISLNILMFEPAPSGGKTKNGSRRQLLVRAETARATGRRYQIDFDTLDVQSLRELVRLIRNLDHEKQAAVNRACMMPWRRQLLVDGW